MNFVTLNVTDTLVHLLRILVTSWHKYMHNQRNYRDTILILKGQRSSSHLYTTTSFFHILVCPIWSFYIILFFELTLYRMVMPIGTPFLKEKINN